MISYTEAKDSHMRNDSILQGYSGLQLKLYKDKQGLFIVRKKSLHEKQNLRLQQQYHKHIFFFNLNHNYFKVPQVLGSGSEDGLFYYDYRYVSGVTLLKFIADQPTEKILVALEKIVKIINELKENETYYEKDNQDISFLSMMVTKIKDNCKKCNLDSILENKFIDRLKGLSDHQSKTLSHGDFSFDNIIIDEKGELWLIDSLDLFYSHYWLDVSKLFQDIDGGWSEIKHGITLPKEKVDSIRGYLINKIDEIDPKYLKYHNFLMAIVFLRILPYAKSGLDKRKIMDKINMFINY